MTEASLHASEEDGAVPVFDSASIGDYVSLMKPRVMALVIFTALVGYVLAPGAMHPALGAISILAIAVGAGASGAINMWFDRDIDAVMMRTKKGQSQQVALTPTTRWPSGWCCRSARWW